MASKRSNPGTEPEIVPFGEGNSGTELPTDRKSVDPGTRFRGSGDSGTRFTDSGRGTP